MSNKELRPGFPTGLTAAKRSEFEAGLDTVGVLNDGLIEHGPDAVMTVPTNTFGDDKADPSSLRYNDSTDEFEGAYLDGWRVLGGSSGRWEIATVAASISAALSHGYLIDNRMAVTSVVLPLATKIGQAVSMADLYGMFAQYPLTVKGNGKNIYGAIDDLVISTKNCALTFTWTGNARGWIVTQAVGLGQGMVYNRVAFEQTLTTSTTTVTLTYPSSMIDVYVNGLRLSSNRYTRPSDSTVTFTPALTGTNQLLIVEYTPVKIAFDNGFADLSSRTTALESRATSIETRIAQCATIAVLRTFEPTVDGQKVDVVRYYPNFSNGGGHYVYDASDTTTADDGMTCIVTNGGKRWKPVLPDKKLPASRAGLLTGSDVTSRWKTWCACSFDKLVDGNVYVSGVGIMADDTNMYSTAQSGVYITASVSDQITAGNEGSCLEAGNKSQIRGVKFFGQGFNGAGVFIGSRAGVIVDSCEMSNSYAIGVKNYLSVGTKITNNHIFSNRHGVLSQQSDNTLVQGNYVHNISWTTGNNGGGIWTSADTNMLVSANIIHDCADVGVDFEGGYNCKSENNIVRRCRNGELTFFGTSTSLTSVPVMGKNSHVNNLVVRESFAYNKDGVSVNNALTDTAACMVYGTLDVAQDGELAFEGNKVFSISSTGTSLFCFRSRTSDPAGNCKISFKGNKFISYSGYMGTLLDRQDMTFEDNTLSFVGGTVRTTEIRDHRTLNFRRNAIDIYPAAVTGNQVFLLSTAIAVTGTVTLAKNIFTGYDGTWVYIDQINSGRSVTLDDNDFGDDTGCTVIPVSIGAGGVVWKNSRIRLLRPAGEAINFAGVGVLYQSSFVCMDATVWVMLNKKIKCGYRFALKCDKNDTMYLGAIDAGGAVSTGRFPDSTCYATFTGNNITFTTTGSQTISAIIELKLDSTPV